MKLSGWGRYPVVEAEAQGFETRGELAALLARPGEVIPFGMGRSYGDSALAGQVVSSRRYDKFLGFDPATGRLHCESGVSLAEIIDAFLPRGWFLSITPGTRFISVGGGAVASDVHGKNHHKAGCFSSCVESFTLMLADGSTCTCSRKKKCRTVLRHLRRHGTDRRDSRCGLEPAAHPKRLHPRDGGQMPKPCRGLRSLRIRCRCLLFGGLDRLPGQRSKHRPVGPDAG